MSAANIYAETTGITYDWPKAASSHCHLHITGCRGAPEQGCLPSLGGGVS